jgi:hypothetical protein
MKSLSQIQKEMAAGQFDFSRHALRGDSESGIRNLNVAIMLLRLLAN